MGLTFENVVGIAPNAEFECRSGWRDLLEEAAAEMADYPDDWRVVITGGKERMCGLVLFVSYVGRWPLEPVEHFIEDWRKASLAVCEECGAAGRLRLGVVAATRCDVTPISSLPIEKRTAKSSICRRLVALSGKTDESLPIRRADSL